MLLICLALLSQAASADLVYDGPLYSPDGCPLRDGSYWVVFAVCGPDGDLTSPVGVESARVAVSAGVCHVDLGDSVGIADGRLVPLQVVAPAQAPVVPMDETSAVVSGLNADMVDGRHAAAPGSPTAGYLYPLSADGRFPNTVLRTGHGRGLDADMVDLIHASTTPTAGYLYPLGLDGKFPNTVLRTGAGSRLDADKLDGLHAAAFATGGHKHDSLYVNASGDTMTGPLVSSVAQGTAPISVASTTECGNLNAALLNGLTAQQVVGIAVPSGTIVMWAGTSIPTGWHYFTELDGRFPRCAATYGGTGGSGTHSHPYSGQTSLEEDGNVAVGFCQEFPENQHLHSYSGTTALTSHLPPYLDIIFIQKD